MPKLPRPDTEGVLFVSGLMLLAIIVVSDGYNYATILLNLLR